LSIISFGIFCEVESREFFAREPVNLGGTAGGEEFASDGAQRKSIGSW
jgi:hypothetical protein